MHHGPVRAKSILLVKALLAFEADNKKLKAINGKVPRDG